MLPVQPVDDVPGFYRPAAELLLEQYDSLCEKRDRAHKELVAESHKHPVTKQLESGLKIKVCYINLLHLSFLAMLLTQYI